MAMMYMIMWPKTGNLKHLLRNFTSAIERAHDVSVVFDRYTNASINTHERLSRSGSTSSSILKLTLETNSPNGDFVMKNIRNKKALVELCCSSNDSPRVQMLGDSNSEYRHEEADCNIISHLQSLIVHACRHIQVVADDTDTFVMLVFFCCKWGCSSKLSMKKSDGQVIDINATAKQLGDKSLQAMPSLGAMRPVTCLAKARRLRSQSC